MAKASDLVVTGQQLFPIVFGPGSLSPINATDGDTGFEAVVISPSSEVDRLAVNFPDPRDGSSQDVLVSPGAPLIARITGTPARPIIFSVARSLIGTSAYWAADPGAPSPRMTAYCYFQAPTASLQNLRAPLVLNGAGISIVGAGEEIAARRAFYGRDMFSVNVHTSGGNAGVLTVRVYGHNFITGGGSSAPDVLLSTLAQGAGTAAEFSFINKSFDAIAITVQGTPGDSVDIFADLRDLR